MLVGLVVVLAVGFSMAFGLGPVLRRLPEPAPLDPTVGEHPAESDLGPSPEAESEVKIAYQDLARPRFVLGCVVLAMSAAAIVVVQVPARLWPPWLVLCTLGVLLGCIDGATTWLPWRLTWPGWMAMLVAGFISVALGAGWLDLVRLVGAGLIAWLWYLIVYLLTRRQLGLGDVWLAPLIGAPAGMISFTALYLALLLGALVGGLHGLVLLARGHRGAFPYAPSIIAGGFLAPIVLTLLQS